MFIHISSHKQINIRCFSNYHMPYIYLVRKWRHMCKNDPILMPEQEMMRKLNDYIFLKIACNS